MSALPYVETVTDETYDVTDVMMDDCRLLLLQVCSFISPWVLIIDIIGFFPARNRRTDKPDGRSYAMMYNMYCLRLYSYWLLYRLGLLVERVQPTGT